MGGLTIGILNYDSETFGSHRKRHQCRHLFSQRHELARLAGFPEKIPSDDLIRAFTLTGADRDLVVIRRGGSKPLGARASALCTSLPRLRSAQFERSSAIRRLLCRGPARGQPGRDSILRSTRADAPTALQRGSGTPRLLDAPVGAAALSIHRTPVRRHCLIHEPWPPIRWSDAAVKHVRWG